MKPIGDYGSILNSFAIVLVVISLIITTMTIHELQRQINVLTSHVAQLEASK